MTLDELRNEIDAIDKDLTQLLHRRMSIVRQIAQIKEKLGLPILQTDREKAVVERAERAVPPDYAPSISSIYRYILSISKSFQRDYLSRFRSGGYFDELYGRAPGEITQPRVTIQGASGSYAMNAARRMYPSAEISYVEQWDDIFTTLADENCDCGVLPLENSTAGSVTEVYDLLIRNRFYIVKALRLPVNHCLLGVRGAHLSDIRKVYSHPQALRQCFDFLQNNRRMIKCPYTNTALAAQFIAHQGLRDQAAIASRDCAYLYGLDILAEGIQTGGDNNCTRFVAVSRQPTILPDANRISLVFTLPHITGSLYRILTRFALEGLNLTKIESRPDPQKPFEYYFYLDFTGSLASSATRNLLSSLQEELPTFHFIGCYPENDC